MKPEPRSCRAGLDSEVRQELDRILASELFRRSPRLTDFLRFVTERTLDGQGHNLKETELGVQLYGKGPEFKGAADPIIRVDARRLRDKLREYYATTPPLQIVISLPKGTYVPVFSELQPSPLPETAPAPAARSAIRRFRSRWVAALAAGVLVGLASQFAWRVMPGRSESRPIRVSTFQGSKLAPALSPDGRFLAFSSKGPEESGLADIWIKAVDGDSLRRLTQTPDSAETSPAWSPDGREVAFIRTGRGVFVVPQAADGPERRISPSGTWVDWADGKSVLIRDREGDAPYAIYQVFLDHSERRRLTQPVARDGDWRFSVSPDGTRLAFIRNEPDRADVYITSMQGGEPRRVTNGHGWPEGVGWTPDGNALVYTTAEGIWRVPADLAWPAEGSRLKEAAMPATNLSISRPTTGKRGRLAFQAPMRDLSLRIIDLNAPLYRSVLQSVKPLPVSTGNERPGPFSPDSRHFAYVAGNSPQLRVAAVDGTDSRQISSVNASGLSLGSWSPDGRNLLYHASINGNTDVFTIDVASGVPRRLTFEPATDGVPSWSHDGRWIYYASTHAGSRPDIWRISPSGGPAVRITYHGGFRPQESPDSKFLYYVDDLPPVQQTRPRGTVKLMRVPIGGGPESVVRDGLSPFWWSVTNIGIYFISTGPEFDAIDRYAFSDGKVSRIGRLAAPAGIFGGQMTVSPDGHWALVTQQRGHSELMLLDSVQ